MPEDSKIKLSSFIDRVVHLLKFNVHHSNLIAASTGLCLCIGFGVQLNVQAADKTAFTMPYFNRHIAENSTDGEGLQQTLNLNFSPEDRLRLRKALDAYARSVDPAHEQIAERRRAMQESIETRFLAADKDNDGSIDRQEATESLPQIARHFSSVDTNQDGLITVDELQTVQSRIEERRKTAEAALQLQNQDVTDVNSPKRKNKQAANNGRKNAL